MTDFVYIKHEASDVIGGPVTRQSFDLLWEPKGWHVVDAPSTVEEDMLKPDYDQRQAEKAAKVEALAATNQDDPESLIGGQGQTETDASTGDGGESDDDSTGTPDSNDDQD